MAKSKFKQLKAFVLYTKTLVILSGLSDENIAAVIRAVTEYYAGKPRPNTDDIDNIAVSTIIDDMCDCIDEAEAKRQRKSNAGKAGMTSRYNSTITEEQQNTNTVITKDNSVITEDTVCYNSDITYNKNKNKNEKDNEKDNKNKTDTDNENNIYIVPQSDKHAAEVKEIIDYLNEKTGKHYSPKAKKAIEHIHARLNEGYCVDDFKRAIDNKAAQWTGTQWEKFLRPSTLFNSEKFEGYANETPVIQETLTKTAQDCDRIAGWLERRQSQ